MAIKGVVMSEEEIAELIQAVSEDFTSKQLDNEAYMMKELRYLLGLKDCVLQEIIRGVRELKTLRGDILPLWAQCMQRH